MGWKDKLGKKAMSATGKFLNEEMVPAFKRGFGGKLKAADAAREAGESGFKARAAKRGTGKLASNEAKESVKKEVGEFSKVNEGLPPTKQLIKDPAVMKARQNLKDYSKEGKAALKKYKGK
jgi:hypothetical protein